jgi:transcriptional regulator with XRE-family HTH domain
MTTGQTLRRLRRAQGWTQHELARRLAVTPRTVGRWEQGSVIPPERVARLLRYVVADPTIPRGGKR